MCKQKDMTTNYSPSEEAKPFIDFAIGAHANVGQMYDHDIPYSFHLLQTAMHGDKHKHLLATDAERLLSEKGCWGHDLLEDVGTISYNDLAKVFGRELAEVSFLLQTPKGRNRKERHCPEYYIEISRNKIATFVKICDRLANVGYGLAKGSDMVQMYKKEQNKFALYLASRYPEFKPMWVELETMFNTLVSTADEAVS